MQASNNVSRRRATTTATTTTYGVKDIKQYEEEFAAMGSKWKMAEDYISVLKAKPTWWASAYIHGFFVSGVSSNQRQQSVLMSNSSLTWAIDGFETATAIIFVDGVVGYICCCCCCCRSKSCYTWLLPSLHWFVITSALIHRVVIVSGSQRWPKRFARAVFWFHQDEIPLFDLFETRRKYCVLFPKNTVRTDKGA